MQGDVALGCVAVRLLLLPVNRLLQQSMSAKRRRDKLSVSLPHLQYKALLVKVEGLLKLCAPDSVSS